MMGGTNKRCLSGHPLTFYFVSSGYNLTLFSTIINIFNLHVKFFLLCFSFTGV